ncbi:Alcohol dehydrogenase (EC [Olavius algarvensis associated proteobacterium Delta 3]|nr:Alcohol dehydrogenase (EC [Olavius algarvensis associated proteobacterium Delta 3]CAB5115057.1 Alcohol dehydrogenase (EC [Olavius algarvensis associated proteobacterium Delta 3]
MSISSQMTAAVLTGHGGLDKLVVRNDIPVPKPAHGEVLIKVGACGVNNTDINTRIGWYSKAATEGPVPGEGGDTITEDASWGGTPIVFPRIQGADVAGRITAVGDGVSSDRIGERVLVDPVLRDPADPGNRYLTGYFGSERDGGFAQYTTVPQENAVAVQSELSDAELATFPCSYSTGENMLSRVRLGRAETILIPGASGGVGSALVQLAKRRGAWVLAITSRSKMDVIGQLGADSVLDRGTGALEAAIQDSLPEGQLHVVADVVGGSNVPMYLDALCRGGRYVTSGAIAGPVVEIDMRTIYLKDLELHGATITGADIFRDLVGYIENSELRPLLAKTFPLRKIHEAQKCFQAKKHVGNLVLLP